MKKRMIITLICSLVLTGCSQFSDTIVQAVSDSMEIALISEKATEAGYTAEGEEDESKSKDNEDIGTRKEDPAKDGDAREESEVETSKSEETATETEHHGNVSVTVYFRDGEDWKWESCSIIQSDWYFLDFDNTVLSYSEFYEAVRKADAIEIDAEGREMLSLRTCSLEEGYEEYKTYAEQYKTFTDRYAMLTFSDMLEHDERYLKTYANTAQNRNQFFRSDDIAYQEIMDTAVAEEAKESYAAITEYGEENYWVERSRGAEATYIDHGDYYEIPDLCIWTRFIVPAEIMQQCRDGYTFTIRPNDEDYTVTVVSSYIATDDDHITSFQLNDDTFIFYNRDENGKPIDGSGCIMAVDEIYTATGLYYGSLCFRKDCKFSFYNSSGTEMEQSSFADYWERKSFWTFFYGKPVFDMETGLITEFQEYWVQ